MRDGDLANIWTQRRCQKCNAPMTQRKRKDVVPFAICAVCVARTLEWEIARGERPPIVVRAAGLEVKPWMPPDWSDVLQ